MQILNNKSQNILNAGGWRGIIDKELTNKTIAVAAQAFSEYLLSSVRKRSRIKVAVAHDGRLHSKPFALLFARVLSGNNIVVHLSDKIGPTPVLSYYVKSAGMDAGVMITASDFPAEYNGIQFKGSSGEPLPASELRKIISNIGHDLVQADDENILQVDLRSDYNCHVESVIDFSAIKNSSLKILVDSMSGAGQQVIETLLLKYDIPVKTINKIAEKDFSNRIPDPTHANLSQLAEELKKDDYSLGIALDGDAGRMALMTPDGSYVHPQETALILADYILNNDNNSGLIVASAAVTDKINTAAAKYNNSVASGQLSFQQVSEQFIKSSASLGCTDAGEFCFSSHTPDKDGIFAALLAAEMLARSGAGNLQQFLDVKRNEYGSVCVSRHELQVQDALGILMNLAEAPPDNIAGLNVLSYHKFADFSDNITGIKFTLQNLSGWILLQHALHNDRICITAESVSDIDSNSLIEAAISLLNSN